jgi:hypothetical protein
VQLPSRAELESQLREGFAEHVPALLEAFSVILGEPIPELTKAHFSRLAADAAPMFETLIQELVELGQSPSPEETSALVNRWIRAHTDAPPGMDPVSYYMMAAQIYAHPQLGWDGPLPRDARSIFKDYWSFLEDLVGLNGLDPVLSLHQDAYFPSGGPSLAPQLSRLQLSRTPPRILAAFAARSRDEASRLFAAWMPIAADWDQLTRVAFGLAKLAHAEVPTWAKTGDVKLFDRAMAIRRVPRLAGLAPASWVTVRNAMAHGHHYFDPSTRECVFPDLRRTVRLCAQEVRAHSRTMAFVNLTLAKTHILSMSATIHGRSSGLFILSGGSTLARHVQSSLDTGLNSGRRASRIGTQTHPQTDGSN